MGDGKADKLPVILLAGGKGTRLGHSFDLMPKPLVKIGPYPVIMHIIAIYYRAGCRDFFVCMGFRANYFLKFFDEVCVHKSENTFEVSPLAFPKLFGPFITKFSKPFTVTLLDTGLDDTTSSRLKQALSVIESQRVLCTYGDGLARIDINDLISHHEYLGVDVTLTAFNPPSRFGEIIVESNGRVVNFEEKQLSRSLVNGGFFVMERTVEEDLDPNTSLESGLLSSYCLKGKLGAYIPGTYWQMMDTPREVEILNEVFVSGRAPWIE